MAINVGSVTVDIVPDLTKFNARMREFTRDLTQTIDIRPNLSQADMARVKAQIDSTSGTVKVGVDKGVLASSIADGIRQASSMTGLDALSGIVNATVGTSLKAGLGGALVSVASAASQAGGAIALLPAGIAALAAPLATVKIGMSGVSDALKQFSATTPAQMKAAQAAMAGLAPAARDLVTQLGALKPAWSALRLDVQQNLLVGVGTAVRQLAVAELPTLRSGLVGIADGLNGGIMSALTTLRGLGPQLSALFGNVTTAARSLGGTFGPLIDAFTRVASVGSSFLPDLAGGFFNAADAADKWVQNAEKTGELTGIIQTAIGAIGQLGNIVGTVAHAIGGIFQAAMGPGFALLGLIDGLAHSLSAIINSDVGQSALGGFFASIQSAAGVLEPVLATIARVIVVNVLPALGQILQAVAPVIAALGTALAGAVVAVTQSIPSLSTTVGDLFNALSPLISIVGQIVTTALPPLLQAMDTLAPAVGAVSTALGNALLDAVKTIAPMLPGLAQSIAQLVTTFVQGAGPILNIAIGALPPLITGLEGVLDIANKLGPVLPLMVAGFLAFKGVSAVADQVSAFSKSLSGLASQLSAKGGALGSLGSGLSGVASAAGPAAAGIGFTVAAAALWVEAGQKATDVAVALGRAYKEGGAQAASAAEYIQHFSTITSLANNSAGLADVKFLGVSFKDLIPSAQGATKAYSDWYAALSPSHRLTEDVTVAQQHLADVMADPRHTAAQAASASAVYQGALARQKAADDGLNQAEQTHLQNLEQIANQQLASVNSGLAAQQAQLQFKGAIDQLNAGLKDGSLKGAALEQAQLNLGQSAIQAAQAAGQQAADQAKANGVTDTASASNGAMLKSLQDNEKYLTGPAKAAVDQQIQILQNAAQATKDVQSQTTNMGLNVVATYGNNVAIVKGATDAQIKDLESLGNTVTHLPNGNIVVTANTDPAQQTIKAFFGGINAISGTLSSVFSIFGGKKALGGPILGPGSGTSDTAGLFALSNGEHVWTAAEVQAAGGHSGVAALRSAVLASGGGLAAGGPAVIDHGALAASNRAIGPTFNDYLNVVYSAVIDQSAKSLAGSFAASAGTGAARWTGLVSQVVGMLGLPAAAIAGILNIIQHESGGNPTAINLIDSNAAAGHPSQGLMQTIPSTFYAYAGPYAGLGITNPLANIYAGTNYALHRYGVGFLEAGGNSNSVGRYIGYDAGGTVPPGYSLHYNGTGAPEVVAPAQNFQQALAQMGGGGGHQYTVIAQFGSETIEATAVRVVDHALGSAADSLHYAGG